MAEAAHHAHHRAHHLRQARTVVARSAGIEGSLRQRGLASWELRVYAGIDPDTRRHRYRSATVHVNRADAKLSGRARGLAVGDSQTC